MFRLAAGVATTECPTAATDGLIAEKEYEQLYSSKRL